MTVIERNQPARHRAIFLSDIHLGTRGCQAELLLDFLQQERERDALPGRRHRRRLAAEALVVLAAGAQRRGAEDPAQGAQGHARHLHPRQPRRGARDYCQLTLRRHRRSRTRRSTPPPTAAAAGHPRRPVRRRRAATRAGSPSWATGPTALALRSTTTFNWAPPQLGLPYWSLSAYLKHKVKNAVSSSTTSSTRWRDEARRRGVDGVVCGHIHQAEIREHRRHPLLQRRRLGRELHRAGRGLRRPPAHRALGRGGGAARRHAAASGGARAHGGGVAGLRIAIVSDAWAPQINGVVRTHRDRGPAPARRRPRSRSVRARPLPHAALPDLSRDPALAVSRRAAGAHAEALCARRHPSRDRGPAGLGGAQLLPAPATSPSPPPITRAFPNTCAPASGCRSSWSYAFVRRFHAPSAAVLVVAQSIRDELDGARLQESGAVVARRRHRGLPARARARRPATRRPIWLYAGRVAIEKNIKAFLELDLPGTKWVVGGGPQLKELKRRYQDAHFFGSVDTEELRRATPRPTASSSRAAPTRSAW